MINLERLSKFTLALSVLAFAVATTSLYITLGETDLQKNCRELAGLTRYPDLEYKLCMAQNLNPELVPVFILGAKP
jgi:hypothetical protein